MNTTSTTTTLTLTTKEIGLFDKASRYDLREEFKTETSNEIRTPSRAFPFSIYKHVFTKKYAKALAIKLGVEEVIIVK